MVHRQAAYGHRCPPDRPSFSDTALAARSAPVLTCNAASPLAAVPTLAADRVAPKFSPGQQAYKSTCIVSNVFPLPPKLAIFGKLPPPHFSLVSAAPSMAVVLTVRPVLCAGDSLRQGGAREADPAAPGTLEPPRAVATPPPKRPSR
jgi:hypothetical protein